MLDAAALTRDSPRPGVVVYQPARGFRYAMDPILLAGWALEGGRPASFLDAGTGSGILALLLAAQGIPGLGVDVLPLWIDLARRSAAESAAPHLRFELGDLRSMDLPEVELAVCNPPYQPRGGGPVPAEPTRAHGRHELAGGLSELIPALARVAPRVALVLPAGRAREAVELLARAGRPLARRCRLEPALVLLEGRSPALPAPDGPLEEVLQLRRGGAFHPRVRRLYERAGVDLPAAPPPLAERPR